MILPNQSRIVIQGITGRYGEHYTKRMIDYGTPVVAGVTPTRGGEWFENRPIFDTVRQAVESTDANVSLVAVPAPFASDALLETIDAGIKTIVCLTEHIPVHDMLKVVHVAKQHEVTLLGPNTSGLLIPNKILLGMILAEAGSVGNIGVVAKSGTLLCDVGLMLTRVRLGQTALISIGSDPICGVSLRDVLELFESDPATERVVLLGEIGGQEEMVAADFIREEMTKPVIGMIAGHGLPQNKRFGHASAISQTGTTAEEKIDYLLNAGVRIAQYMEQIPQLLINQD
jgi:succinyl-CoA synthetase alpha subunit